jgi:hypothetical protein
VKCRDRLSRAAWASWNVARRTLPAHRRVSTSGLWLSLLSALMMSGCNSATPDFPSLGSPAATHTASIGAWDQCLRDHRVAVPAGYDPYSPAAGSTKPDASGSVEAACAPLLPPAPAAPAAVRQEFVAWARCMRTHDIPAPDPTFLPNGDVVETMPLGVGPAMPGYTAAAKACGAETGLPALVPGTR